MTAEIYWSLSSGGDTELIPGKVVRVLPVGRELRLTYAGRHAATGDSYSGVLRLKLHTGKQTYAFRQAYKPNENVPESDLITVTGQFVDDKLQDFSGTWLERGHLWEVEIVGLPPVPPARKRSPKRSNQPRVKR